MTNISRHCRIFPFAAIVGQDELKLALVINAVVPGGMGVLIRGEKGTAKSTCARALAALLPESPFITLPVNATEDNLVGGLDFEYAVCTGQKKFQPGLLAKAHKGILYVDEVNLLDDHLVDLIIDVAASGVNTVEREGVSFTHASNFVLIGTMNPEEGELRPQFLDRFGLCVHVRALKNPAQRAIILRRLEEFAHDPVKFRGKWEPAQKKERCRIQRAIDLFGLVLIDDEKLEHIARICGHAQCAGHRADIAMEKAARAHAAYDGKTRVRNSDIRAGAFLALGHRMRQPVFTAEKQASLYGEIDLQDIPLMPACEKEVDASRQYASAMRQDLFGDGQNAPYASDAAKSASLSDGRVFEIGEPVIVSAKDLKHGRTALANKKGRGPRSVSKNRTGRYIRSTAQRTNNDIALDATLRAAALFQARRSQKGLAVAIELSDIREKIRERKSSSLLIFIVDASGSMGTRLMTETKGAIMSLLLEAYQNRDRVCLIAFKDYGSQILLPPTDSIELAKTRLKDLPSGGKTPLTAGLICGYELACARKRRNQDLCPILILISDGRANVGADPKKSYALQNAGRIYDEIFAVAHIIYCKPWIKTIVIDTEPKNEGGLGMSKRIAETMGAKYIAPHKISSTQIARAVQGEV